MTSPLLRLCLPVALGTLLVALPVRAAEQPKTPPDLTLDRSVDRKLTYNLGPTGLRGWIRR